MEDWTEEQLREAVDKKHGKEKNKATTTDKICNEFIKAVETKKLVINLFNIFMDLISYPHNVNFLFCSRRVETLFMVFEYFRGYRPNWVTADSFHRGVRPKLL